jgi:hypothetical protein
MEDINKMGKVTEVKVEDNVKDKTVFIGTADYDSGWRVDNNSSNHTTIFEHNLGAIPSQLTVLFSSDLETVYPVTWPWQNNYSGNPVTISMNSNSICLNIFNGVPLHGVWSGTSGQWTTSSAGYWRIKAWK